MQPNPRILAMLATGALMLSAPAAAQLPFTLGLFVGIGGSVDEADTGLGETSVMAKLALESGPRSEFAVRVGEMDLDELGPTTDATLTYVTMSGDYWAYESFYESALYLGLGYYELSALQEFTPVKETSVGVVLGAAGDWALTRNLSLQVELAAHYAPMDTAQLFLMAHGGVAVHF